MKTLEFFIIILLMTHCNQLFSQDLLAHWSFDDGTARDVTGNGYDGVMVNNPTVVPGVVGNALHFQGKGYYIPANGDVKQIGSHVLLPPINLHGLNEFTITMWVYEEGFSSWYGEAYLWFGHHQRGWFGIINTPSYPYNPSNPFRIQFAVAGYDVYQNLIDYQFDSNFKNSWVCYALSYKNGVLLAYIQGQLVGSINTKTHYTSDGFALGRHWWYYEGQERTSARFTGAIDEVKIFLRALSEDEIKFECLSCGPMSFSYNEFSKTPQLRLINNAHFVNNFVRLTSSMKNQYGALWTSHLVPVGSGFETSFKFRFSNGTNPNHSEQHFPGADGFAFVIQNASPFAIGSLGGGIGYDGIPNSLAIEFDTYANDSNQIENFLDPNDNHIAILSNGTNPNSSKHILPYIRAQTTKIMPLKTDGTIYTAKIEYDANNKKITVWLDTTEKFANPVLEASGIDLRSLLNLDQFEGAYIGFTSATGNAYENHDILSWNFCTKSWKIFSIIEEKELNNLTYGELTIYSESYQTALIECYDLLGRLLLQQHITLLKGTNNIDLNLKKLGLKIYPLILIVRTKENVIFTKLLY